MISRIIPILILLVLTPIASAWPYFFGGLVIDPGKIVSLGVQYTSDVNKLNLLGAQDKAAKDQVAEFTAMQKAFGDGSGVAAYVPKETVVDTDTQKAIDAYSKALPYSPQGQVIKEYMQRQKDRETLTAVYNARIREIAKKQEKPLTLEQSAAVWSEIEGVGMDARMNQIAANADSGGIKAYERQMRLNLMEYRANKEDLERSMRE